MARLLAFVAALALIAAALLRSDLVAQLGGTDPAHSGVPIETIAAARGQPLPALGLAVPLPAWIVLPERGRAISAGVYAPQPPYGAAASLTLIIEDAPEAFAAAYAARLRAAGYDLREIPPQFNVAFDEPDLQLEADERPGDAAGGHVIYIALRHTRAARFAQLTFWDPPAPRMP